MYISICLANMLTNMSANMFTSIFTNMFTDIAGLGIPPYPREDLTAAGRSIPPYPNFRLPVHTPHPIWVKSSMRIRQQRKSA